MGGYSPFPSDSKVAICRIPECLAQLPRVPGKQKAQCAAESWGPWLRKAHEPGQALWVGRGRLSGDRVAGEDTEGGLTTPAPIPRVLAPIKRKARALEFIEVNFLTQNRCSKQKITLVIEKVVAFLCRNESENGGSYPQHLLREFWVSACCGTPVKG